ncbi:MAG: hypothetical protein KGJ66_10545 [Alphaproteobacteria bacterium]|nr:hypothetical protein [Alphaproteobacteria bacterium]
MRENSIDATDTRRLNEKVVEPTIVRGAGYAVVHWSNLDGTNRTSGEFVRMPGFKLQRVQILGSFGGAVTIVVRNDEAGATIVTLKDRSGQPVCVMSTQTHQIAAPTDWVAPVAAVGVSDVDVLAVYERAPS